MAKTFGLVPKFKDADIKKFLNQALIRLDEAIVLRFSYVGENFIANAKLKGTYNDVTGNLRASPFYQILVNGKRRTGSDLGSGDVGKANRKLMSELRGQFSNGYVLIVGMGMEYAAAVESRGKDVLTGSSLIAKRDLQKAMEAIKRKMKNGQVSGI